MKISFSKAASTLSLAALAMTAATSAQAAITNLDLNIKRVILVKDTNAFDDIADTNADGNEYVAFEAATSADNQVINLLSTSARNGITLSLNPVTAAQAGVYRNVIIELDNDGGNNQIGFSSLSDQPTATPQDISSSLTGLTTVGGTSQFILLGTKGAVPSAAFDTAFDPGLASIASMKPVELSEGTATLPSLDIQIPAAAVVDAGPTTAATFTQAVVAQSFAPASIANTNSTSIRDLKFTIADAEMAAFNDAAAANSTDTLKAGLFTGNKGLAGKAEYTASLQIERDGSGDVDVSAADDASVTFVDVAFDDYYVAIWGDDNNNDIVDVGEEFVTGGATGGNTAVNTAFEQTTLASGDPETAEVTTKALDLAAASDTMVTPTLTVSIPVDSDATATLPNNAFEITLDAGPSDLNGDTAPAAGTVTLTIGGTSYDLAASYVDKDVVTSPATFADTEVATAVLTAGSVTAIDSISSISYTADTALEVTLPFISVTGLAANGLVGTVPVVGLGVSVDAGAADAVLANNFVPNAITGTVANGDYTTPGEIAIVNSDTSFAE